MGSHPRTSSTRPIIALDGTLFLRRKPIWGIGRYAMELIRGLEALRPEWESDLDIRLVTDIQLQQLELDEDLSGAMERLRNRRIERNLRLQRRFSFGPALRRQGAALMHTLEHLSTPLFSVPRVVTCHDLYPLSNPGDYLQFGSAGLPLRYVQEWHRYARARRVIAISQQTERDLLRWLPGLRGRVDVVPNGIDLDTFSVPPTDESVRALAVERDSALLGQLGVAPDRPFLLFVGDFGDPRKNFSMVLETVEKLSDLPELRLYVVGNSNTASAEDWVRAVVDRGLGQRVRSLGYVDDTALRALYRRTVAVLLLSHFEGFGYPVAEALASGTAPIVLTGSGCDEMVGDAGFAVSDAVQAAGAVRQLLAERAASRGDRSERCRSLAERFDRASMARGHLAAYRRALEV